METNNEMTVERSLEIISRHIEQSRKDITKNAGLPMILWGVMTIVTGCIVGYMWKTTGSANWNFLWFFMAIIGWVIMLWMSHKEKRKKLPVTFMSQVMSSLWLAFGIFASALAILLYVMAPFAFSTRIVYISYTPIIILLIGVCTTATGLILKQGWITAGGIIGGLAGAALAYSLPGPYEAFVMAGVALVTLLIPGIMINGRKDYV